MIQGAAEWLWGRCLSFPLWRSGVRSCLCHLCELEGASLWNGKRVSDAVAASGKVVEGRCRSGHLGLLSNDWLRLTVVT